MNAFILIVVILNVTVNNPGAGSAYEVSTPAVTMQEFEDERACVFAGSVIIRRAKHMAERLSVACVPKGSK